jgi:hypothetical protein
MLRVGSSSGLFLKAGAGAGGELAHKVRIFWKCLNFLPWTILQFVLSCTSRLVGIAFVAWRLLLCSFHLQSLMWLPMESASIWSSFLIFSLRCWHTLFDHILSMCDQSSVCCNQRSLQFYLFLFYGNYFSSILGILFSILWIWN